MARSDVLRGDALPAAKVEPVTLRTVMRQLATGVTVVATDSQQGPVGVAINSFTSVSLNPPLVLFCIGRESRSWPAIEATQRFAVSFLTEEQEQVARRFCASGVDRFVGQDLRTAVTGAPILATAAGYVDCTLDQVIEAGDHHVVLGRVVGAGVLNHARPLVFTQGTYRSG
ncbi:flavin reductase family protein [Solwaraspora sp. WMMD1047]|uniref:flavin reductase family protein n=1 Tax=Solwaraspora sp. WMMD1047 TaxID=3016102 RepID=UPI002415E124|nr:flavin reductase family protein [Solwaraspora sp. WMMD1047]MDG4830632.1 flavin reductase family protein [Solwaraspora sp. WMMD1047]